MWSESIGRRIRPKPSFLLCSSLVCSHHVAIKGLPSSGYTSARCRVVQLAKMGVIVHPPHPIANQFVGEI